MSMQRQSRSLRSRFGIRIKQAIVGGNSLAKLARTTPLLPKVAVKARPKEKGKNNPARFARGVASA